MKVWLSLLVCVAGCGSGTSTNSDQPPVFVQPTPSDPMNAAVLGCLGGHGDPAAPTVPTPVDITVKDFEKSTPVMGATVEVYLSLDHVNAMMPDATAAAPTDADGNTTIMVPPGSYRVIFRTVGAPNTIETLEFNRVYNDGARVSVSQATKSEIPALLNLQPDDTKGVVAGSQRDCLEAELGGVTVSMMSTGGAYDNSMNVFYFQDFGTSRVPALAQKWTSGDGAFAGLNVPPGNVTVTAFGKDGPSSPQFRLGTGLVPVRAGSITIVQLEPLGPGQ
ncbi:MAG TPA: hypothetical protein VN947_32420 [Polyangia bacterium]|nr:hypothetical protein [Polyangia bacterium]